MACHAANLLRACCRQRTAAATSAGCAARTYLAIMLHSECHLSFVSGVAAGCRERPSAGAPSAKSRKINCMICISLRIILIARPTTLHRDLDGNNLAFRSCPPHSYPDIMSSFVPFFPIGPTCSHSSTDDLPISSLGEAAHLFPRRRTPDPLHTIWHFCGPQFLHGGRYAGQDNNMLVDRGEDCIRHHPPPLPSEAVAKPGEWTPAVAAVPLRDRGTTENRQART